MTKVSDVAAWMERFAPFRLAESWDNVGLLAGDPAAACRWIMTCLTVTPESASEAAESGADLVVSHHPLLFKPVQQFRADQPETAPLWILARAGISLYSPHTAFDNCVGGINDGLAHRLGLMDVGPLAASNPRELAKIVVFVPVEDREAVLTAGFGAGAGKIGAYGECSFSAEGIGTFHGDDTTTPAVGQPGRRESVAESRVELICEPGRADRVAHAIRSAHPYEEPAIDIYKLRSGSESPGIGRVGDLPSPTTLGAFADRIAQLLPAPALQYVGDPDRPVRRVAVACGGADSMIPEAHRAGADVFLTGEARFHRGLEAEALGLSLIVAGHHATERPAVENLAKSLAAAFPALHCWPSRRERDPFCIRGSTVGSITET